MSQNHELASKIHDQLKKARKILVITHQRPDGDAIGSLLGIGLPLFASGKDVQMVISEGLDDKFRFLSGVELIQTKPVGEFDYIIVLDSGDIERTDTVLHHYGLPDLNIDHHRTNTNFAKTNLIEIDAVATAEILANYLPSFGLHINKDIANALIVGIITDTIGFRTTNVMPGTLRTVADLMDLGGDLPDIYYRTLVEQSYSAARYWGMGLSKLMMEEGIVWTTLSLAERAASGYDNRDDADLVKVLSAIEEAKIAVILTEQSQGYVKISWRLCGSLPTDLDVSEIALRFGGGGHKAAAGADIKGKLSEVLEKVLMETRLYMRHVERPIREIG